VRSHPTPSHLICASDERPGAPRVRARSQTCFAGRSDALATVIALAIAPAPGSSPTRCEHGSSFCGPLQVLSLTAFDMPIILATSDTFSAALEVPRPLPRLLRRRASRRGPPPPPAAQLDAQLDGGSEALAVAPSRPLLTAEREPPAGTRLCVAGRVISLSDRPHRPL